MSLIQSAEMPSFENYIQPGRPTQNAFVESFNARCREERLDQELFLNLDYARAKIDR